MKRLFGLLIILFICSFVFSSSVVRELPSTVASNQEFNVSLIITVSENDSFYGIEEYLPANFTIVNSDGGETLNNARIKWLNIDAIPGEEIITYTLRAPATPGNYSFDGQSMFETQYNPEKIGGNTQITITEETQGNTAQKTTTNLMIVFGGIIILGILIFCIILAAIIWFVVTRKTEKK